LKFRNENIYKQELTVILARLGAACLQTEIYKNSVTNK